MFAGRRVITNATLLACVLLIVAGCASQSPESGRIQQGPSSYTVKGQTYRVRSDATGFRQTGEASWYGPGFDGRRTASGQIYDMHKLTAAHKTLPLGSRVRVTNLSNDRHVDVLINDRGPFHGNRVIDLSYAAAQRLGMRRRGRARVRISVLGANRADTDHTKPRATSNADNYLQAGAFDRRSHAVRQRRRIRSLGIDAVRIRRGTGPRALYLVQVGPFADTSSRRRVRQRLSTRDITAVPLDG